MVYFLLLVLYSIKVFFGNTSLNYTVLVLSVISIVSCFSSLQEVDLRESYVSSAGTDGEVSAITPS